jgi:hypothetical protein
LGTCHRKGLTAQLARKDSLSPVREFGRTLTVRNSLGGAEFTRCGRLVAPFSNQTHLGVLVVSKAKQPRYKVEGDYIYQHSVTHKSTGNFFIAMDELDFYAANDTEVTKLRIGSAHESVYYTCDLDTLRSVLEDETYPADIREADGQEGFLVPVYAKLWKRCGSSVGAVSDNDRWIQQRSKIIEESGGLWSQAKRQAWADKFTYKAPLKKGY